MIFKTKQSEVSKSYQNELFPLNMFIKNKHNRLRQTNKNEKTIIKYSFYYLFYFSSDKLAKHKNVFALFPSFNLPLVCLLQSKGPWVFIKYSVLKHGTHLPFNAIKMLKKISLALLTQVET